MKTASVTATLLLVLSVTTASAWVTAPTQQTRRCLNIQMTSEEEQTKPTSFRDAEVLGLRFMQDGQFEDALKTFKEGMKLPGSRPDVIRTKLLSGPSPVGGAIGGFDNKKVLQLDEFELQAAHYNMACAYAQLLNVEESVANLEKAFECGFDNFSTVRGDPDLKGVQGTEEFDDLMEKYDSQKGFNPFGLFKK